MDSSKKDFNEPILIAVYLAVDSIESINVGRKCEEVSISHINEKPVCQPCQTPLRYIKTTA